jgi:hypothetical protein
MLTGSYFHARLSDMVSKNEMGEQLRRLVTEYRKLKTDRLVVSKEGLVV